MIMWQCAERSPLDEIQFFPSFGFDVRREKLVKTPATLTMPAMRLETPKNHRVLR